MVRRLVTESEEIKFSEVVKTVMYMDAVAKSTVLMSGEVNEISKTACFGQLAIEAVQYVGASRGHRQHPPQRGRFTCQPYREMASQNGALTSKKQDPQNTCSCGVRHQSGSCPARRWICYNCGRLGHIAKACAIASQDLYRKARGKCLNPIPRAFKGCKWHGVAGKQRSAVSVTDEVSGSFHKLTLLVARDLSAPALLGRDWLSVLCPGWQYHLLANSPVFSMHVVGPSGVVFCRLDLTQAYLQLEVEEPYRELMTINTINGQFIPMCPYLLEPLHNLLCKDVPWIWTSECELAFNKSKTVLSEKALLVVFDPTKEIVLRIDSSGYGVGTVLSHVIDGIEFPITFESAMLTTAQRNYIQLDKEALAKGQHIPQADAMSCLPSTAPVGVKKECTFLYHTTPLVSPDEVAQETKKDQVLRKVMKVCENGWSHHCSNKILETFFTIQHQLFIRDGVLWNGNRAVIPQSLQAKVLSILHYGHSVVVLCQQMQNACNNGFHRNWPAPQEPWKRIHLDLFHFNSVEYLILCDAYSEWVEVFARFAFPHTILCDHGPPFYVRDLTQFCRLRPIKLMFTSPYHPSSNGFAEISVQTFKKLLTRSSSHPSSTVSLSQRLNDCLLTYRSTLSSVPGLSLMASLFSHAPCIPLSMLIPKEEDRRSNPTTRCLSNYKIKQKVRVNLQKSKTLAKWVAGRIIQQLGKVIYIKSNYPNEPDTNENFSMLRPLQQPCQTELEIADRHNGQNSEREEEVEGLRGFPHDEDEINHRVS
ncbi:hypothetical protein PR048_012748, partial [Dryococelus australis]